MRVTLSSHFRSSLAHALVVLLLAQAALPLGGQSAAKAKSTKAKKPAIAQRADSPAKAAPSSKSGRKKPKAIDRSQAARAARAARTAQLKRAFVASSELRPMAQQLANLRTPAAYTGMTNYARQHSGEAAAAAYLAIGHAYMLDHKWSEAIANFELAKKAGVALDDYADFLAARSAHESGNHSQAEALLHGFAQRHPDSVFDDQTPELEAQVLLALGNPQAAQTVLNAAAASGAAGRTGFQLAQGEAALALDQRSTAGQIFKQLYLGRPLTADGQTARIRLMGMGLEPELTTAELRTLGDAYYRAGRYQDAAEQYRQLARKSAADSAAHNSFVVAVAACELKLKTLTASEARALPDTDDDNGARRLYLLMELARTHDDEAEVQRIVQQMQERFPQSSWLGEALFSSGNMHLLKREYDPAANDYATLAARFPSNSHAIAAHWRAGWLKYRLGLYPEASRIFDEQIRRFPTAKETVAALYWRARLNETLDHKPAQAVAAYRNIVRLYPHFFYAQMARQRLAALGESLNAAATSTETPLPLPAPQLLDEFPAESPHLAKARLLANAGLNDYIALEIAADPDSSSWSALAEAQIYASYGETYRALRSLKSALPSAASTPIRAIPLVYWRILFPEPWWDTIVAESAKNHLDPYLVASLIRQESEFNPGAVSHANAYGLMQMLPSVGKAMAHEEGLQQYNTFQLLDPVTNIRLGTRYLRQTLDKFGGVPEYALAAYNAGNNRVTDWQSAGPYQGLDEFVESIPFTETRDYVQAILRNQETYRAIDEFAATQKRKTAAPQR